MNLARVHSDEHIGKDNRRRRHWEIVMGDPKVNLNDQERVSKSSVQKERNIKGDALVCEECNVSFHGKSRVSNFNKHINSVHLKYFPHECRRCTKKFQYRHKLEHHFNTVHRGIKPFSCSECGKQFSDKSNLSKHQNGRSCFKHQTKVPSSTVATTLFSELL